MYNVERYKKGFANNEKCYTCSMQKEAVKHVIQGCSLAREVWERLLPTDTFLRNFSSDFNQWLNYNIAGKVRGKYDKGWATRFAIMTWWIWKWRNKAIFHNSVMAITQRVTWL